MQPSAASRRLQINFRFSRVSRALARERQVGRLGSHFKGVRAMNLSDLYRLFNCVQAAGGGIGRAERTLFRGIRSGDLCTNQEQGTYKYSCSREFPSLRTERRGKRDGGTEGNRGEEM